mmetsp:Transcript_14731/g.36022  ORF Transcript_14731/g.36022 Transcript_14731/m.36022 type:complete len:184 (-) Transcript_14731:4765-5316(-)
MKRFVTTIVVLFWTQSSIDAFIVQPNSSSVTNRRCSPHSHKPSPSSVCTSPRGLHLAADGDSAVPQDDEQAAMDKAMKAMTAFTNKYLKNTETTLCSDLSVPAVVVKGLAEHKVQLGAPLCPCRFYEDKEAEAKNGYWNCPCVPMRERHECHCMLFLTEDNAFAGDQTSITLDEVIEHGGGGA